jgi:hypothetical protein
VSALAHAVDLNDSKLVDRCDLLGGDEGVEEEEEEEDKEDEDNDFDTGTNLRIKSQ